MSNQWEGGKGDRNRTEDIQAWRDNYDKIFGKKKVVVIDEVEPDNETKKIQLYTYAEIEDIIDFLKNIDLEEYPIQKAKELYKKFLTKCL